MNIVDIHNQIGVIDKYKQLWLNAEYSNYCFINGEVRWGVGAQYSNYLTINSDVDEWVNARYSSHCIIHGNVRRSVLAEYSGCCTINGKVKHTVGAEHSNKLAVGKEFDCSGLFIDQELFLLINQ